MKCVITVLLVLIVQCVSTRSFRSPHLQISSLKHIIVYPFENCTSDPHAAQVVTTYFITELRRSFDAKILDAEFLVNSNNVLQVNHVPPLDLLSTDMNQKMKLAKVLHADHIVTGKVTEFKYKIGLGEEPVVGMNVQMIDVAEKEVVWHASISVTRGYPGFAERSLSKFTQKAVCDILKTIKQ